MLSSIGRRRHTVNMTSDLEILCNWMASKLKGYDIIDYNQEILYSDDWERLASAIAQTFNIDISKIKKPVLPENVIPIKKN